MPLVPVGGALVVHMLHFERNDFTCMNILCAEDGSWLCIAL